MEDGTHLVRASCSVSNPDSVARRYSSTQLPTSDELLAPASLSPSATSRVCNKGKINTTIKLRPNRGNYMCHNSKVNIERYKQLPGYVWLPNTKNPLIVICNKLCVQQYTGQLQAQGCCKKNIRLLFDSYRSMQKNAGKTSFKQ